MNVTVWANANETLMHFIEHYNKYGTTNLVIWQDEYGRSIDETVLVELVQAGKLTYTPPVAINMWAEGHYALAPAIVNFVEGIKALLNASDKATFEATERRNTLTLGLSHQIHPRGKNTLHDAGTEAQALWKCAVELGRTYRQMLKGL